MSIISNKLEAYNTEESINSLVEKINKGLPKSGKIYPNQMRCAIKGIKMFDSNLPRPNHLVVRGKTQAGKTGVLTSMLMLIFELKIEKTMSVDSVYYITGDNSCKLINQTIERVSECFKGNENECKFHCLKNSDLKKDINNKQTITNAIVFIDESHYGISKEDNIIIQWLESKGINMHNDKELVDKYVYIISNSATPYGEINSDCGGYKSYVTLDTDDWNNTKGYVGFKEYEEKHCFESITSQMTKGNVEDMCEQFSAHLNKIQEETDKTKCGIIRMSKDVFKTCRKTLEKFFHIETFFATNENIPYDTIDTMMEHKCSEWDKPLVIIVCGAYRMGISIPSYCKKNIGFVFDFATGNSKNSIITTEQGLLGRVTGYWDTDDWCDIKIYINEKHYKSLKSCYVEQAISTPMANVKKKFVPNKNGKNIDIISEDDFIEIPCDEQIGADYKYNERMCTFIKRTFEMMGKPLSDDIIYIPGRRNKEGNSKHFTRPQFSRNEHMTNKILANEENVNKSCFTGLYDSEKKTISILYGKILRGDYVDVFDENKKIIPTLATEAF